MVGLSSMSLMRDVFKEKSVSFFVVEKVQRLGFLVVFFLSEIWDS